jgi:hypothetical protein
LNFKTSIRLVAMASALALAALSTGCSEEITGPSSAPPLMNRPLIGEGHYVMAPVEAIVTMVDDASSVLEGVISVGDTLRGICLYDETAPDLDRKPDNGKYAFDMGPSFMDFGSKGLRFRSDPDALAMTIRLANDVSDDGQNDSVHIISSNNLDVLQGVGVRELHILMIDKTCAALSSDVLLGHNPFAATWPDKNQLTITGARHWTITAEISVFTTAGGVEAGEDPSHGTIKKRPYQE